MNVFNNNDMKKVTIQRQWNDYRQGEVEMEKLSGLGWDNLSGGVNQKSPHYFVYAYVMCNDIEGEISHSCWHGQGPHNIKVVILKKYNLPIWKDILEIVGEKPQKK